MKDNTVVVDAARDPPAIRFAPVFNVAVAFIDRHIDEGRAAKVAIRSTARADVTYGELALNVNRCGNVLKSLGIGQGERMLMVVQDRPEFFYLFWGAIKAGIVPVPVNTLLRAADYRFLIEDSGCAAVVYFPDIAAEVDEALAAAGRRPDHALPTDGAGSILARMEDAPAVLDPAPATATDECFWLYTSGSTGNPKATVHRHRDMVTTSQHYAHATLGVGEHDTVFSAGKLFFSYGFGNSMTFPLWPGATTVLNDQRATVDMTFETIEKFRPTVYFGVPTLYAQQLNAMDERMPDLSSLSICASAGEALPAEVFRRWKEKTGLAIMDGIGSTEALHIFVTNRHDDYRPGSSGRVVAGYQVEIAGEDGDPVAPGETGTLQVKGESTAAYYWNNPEKTAETMLGEWLNTGDMYYQDADGYYVNCGRGDDMLKVGAMWCSPTEVEGRLLEHPKVLEAAVVGRDDDEGLTKPEAFIVLKALEDAGEPLAEELQVHCKEALAGYKYPRWINFVDELPKTVTGKIQRFRLRAKE